ncbi:hypothetical protein N7478_010801 [Penicillium angulare]|uniref:uncharacterized protein n=1 Tax=Penicillium angulare TaxID=116970 RepID=UPI0025404DF0|nr:uncharacterized protein N7478_010801 [Penicillium angulare]KAJ5263196.1 hypothetical protein N7478_010801 [Penicillium angulare]
MKAQLSRVLLLGLFISTGFLHKATATATEKLTTINPKKSFNSHAHAHAHQDTNPHPKLPRTIPKSRRNNLTNWTYQIPPTLENGTSKAHLTIPTPSQTLFTNALLSLERPQISKVTPTSFDWWYFDAISSLNPYESLTITLFSASASSFPWLDSTESSVLIAYLWATFANGSVFSDYIPASLASISGGDEGGKASEGVWSDTGFRWMADGEGFSNYEVIVESEGMGVYGTFMLESELAPHLPCGIQSETTTLKIIPNIGWAALIPSAKGTVNLNIQGTPLTFQGQAYHDKNWSNEPFTSNVQSWYWGHAELESYSIIWFSAIASNNKTYISSYVSQNGIVLVSSCDSDSKASVRPYSTTSATGTGTDTGGRYPPMAGDVPDGFLIELSTGEEVLKFNVSVLAEVAGDGRYYMRWTGNMSGSLGGRDLGSNGVALFEQFVLVE